MQSFALYTISLLNCRWKLHFNCLEIVWHFLSITKWYQAYSTASKMASRLWIGDFIHHGFFSTFLFFQTTYCCYFIHSSLGFYQIGQDLIVYGHKINQMGIWKLELMLHSIWCPYISRNLYRAWLHSPNGVKSSGNNEKYPVVDRMRNTLASSLLYFTSNLQTLT